MVPNLGPQQFSSCLVQSNTNEQLKQHSFWVQSILFCSFGSKSRKTMLKYWYCANGTSQWTNCNDLKTLIHQLGEPLIQMFPSTEQLTFRVRIDIANAFQWKCWVWFELLHSLKFLKILYTNKWRNSTIATPKLIGLMTLHGKKNFTNGDIWELTVFLMSLDPYMRLEA